MTKEKEFQKMISEIEYSRKVVDELKIYEKNYQNSNMLEDKRAAQKQMTSLKEIIKQKNNSILKLLRNINLQNPEEKEKKPEKKTNYKFNLDELEKETVQRIKKQERERKKQEDENKEKDGYSLLSYRVFSKFSTKILSGKKFKSLEEDLRKANLNYTPTGYLSLILFTTLLSAIVGGFIFLFFLFFKLSATMPMIERTIDPLNVRFMKTFWILFTTPILTFFMMYIYPSLERESQSQAIERELPFATMHMAAISASIINPINIFKIIASTSEYPALEKEFTKMINEINIYGYNFVSALKSTAKNTSSKKLRELLNGLSTTISSGGDLPDFFDKRSQTLLFDYKIEQEKAAKSAETFMDIYISIGIATPMILMLLLMMMKLSGFGVPLSIMMIATIIILIVIVLNVILITFLQIKRNK